MNNRIAKLLASILLYGLFVTAVNAQALIGSYLVTDGPFWGDNPPTYSCVEACAEVFGGASASYACSTSDSVIDNQAHVSVWGASGCPVVAEDSKLGTDYNCGSEGCSYSAYVYDNCASANYCYARGVVPPEPSQAKSIPTLGEMGLLLLAMLMLIGGAIGLKSTSRTA